MSAQEFLWNCRWPLAVIVFIIGFGAGVAVMIANDRRQRGDNAVNHAARTHEVHRQTVRRRVVAEEFRPNPKEMTVTDQERAQDMAEQLCSEHKMAMGAQAGPFVTAIQKIVAWLKAQGYSWTTIWSVGIGIFNIISPYFGNWAGLIANWAAVLAAILALFKVPPPNPLPPPAAPAAA